MSQGVGSMDLKAEGENGKELSVDGIDIFAGAAGTEVDRETSGTACA